MLTSSQEAEAGWKEGWMPTQGAFLRLLNWLGGEREYVEMSRRLIGYFDKRGCYAPEDLADKTLDRVMRFLREENKDHYDIKLCFSTARQVFLEELRRPERKHNHLDSVTHETFTDPDKIAALEEERSEKEKLLACLEKCSQELPVDDFNLIIQYYHGEGRVKLENRKTLAAGRGKSDGALRTDACRIRKKLRDCVTMC